MTRPTGPFLGLNQHLTAGVTQAGNTSGIDPWLTKAAAVGSQISRSNISPSDVWKDRKTGASASKDNPNWTVPDGALKHLFTLNPTSQVLATFHSPPTWMQYGIPDGTSPQTAGTPAYSTSATSDWALYVQDWTDFATAAVTRYKPNPSGGTTITLPGDTIFTGTARAAWLWEMGNEWNLNKYFDPNGWEGADLTNPTINVKIDAYYSVYRQVYKAVHTADPLALLSFPTGASGLHGIPGNPPQVGGWALLTGILDRIAAEPSWYAGIGDGSGIDIIGWHSYDTQGTLGWKGSTGGGGGKKAGTMYDIEMVLNELRKRGITGKRCTISEWGFVTPSDATPYNQAWFHKTALDIIRRHYKTYVSAFTYFQDKDSDTQGNYGLWQAAGTTKAVTVDRWAVPPGSALAGTATTLSAVYQENLTTALVTDTQASGTQCAHGVFTAVTTAPAGTDQYTYQSVTTGFVPLGGIFYATDLTTNGISGDAIGSLGLSDMLASRVVGWSSKNGVSTTQVQHRTSDGAICIINPANGNILAEGDVRAETNGFGVRWLTTPSAAYKIHYIVFGGQNVQCKIGQLVGPNSTGGQREYTVPFTPNLIFFMGGAEPVLDDTIDPANANRAIDPAFAGGTGCSMALGVAAHQGSATQYAVLTVGDQNGLATTSNAFSATRNDKAYNQLNAAGGSVLRSFSINQWNTDGFRANWDTATSGEAVWYLACNFANVNVGTDSQAAATNGTSDVACGFAPVGVIGFSGGFTNAQINGPVLQQNRFSFGAADASGASSISTVIDDNVATSVANALSSDATFLQMPDDTGVVKASATIALTSTGFTTTWPTVADTTIRSYAYVAFGDGGVAPPTAPSNTTAPAVSVTGSAVPGATLSASNGIWSGTTPITYTYQWKSNGTSISAATSSTYVIQAGDVGNSITCVVSATNTAGGPIAATSNAIVVVSAPPPSTGDVIGFEVIQAVSPAAASAGNTLTALTPVFYPLNHRGLKSFNVGAIRTKITTAGAGNVSFAIYDFTYTASHTFTGNLQGQTLAVPVASTGVVSAAIRNGPLLLDFTTHEYLVAICITNATVQIASSAIGSTSFGVWSPGTFVMADINTWPAQIPVPSYGNLAVNFKPLIILVSVEGTQFL